MRRSGTSRKVVRGVPAELVRDLLARWDAEVAEYERRALPENASSVEDRVDDSRNAARLRRRAQELREALGE